MRLKIKKIIARELILLLIVFMSGVIFYLSLSGYNQFKDISNNQLNDKLKTIALLRKPIEIKISKQKWLYNHFYEDMSKFHKTSNAFWQRLLFLYDTDSISIKYNGIWKKELIIFFANMGFKNPEDIKYFIETNRLTQEESNYIRATASEIKNINNKIRENHKAKLSSNEKLKLTQQSIGIIFFCLFIVRYLYYIIKWSILTLRIPDEITN